MKNNNNPSENDQSNTNRKPPLSPPTRDNPANPNPGNSRNTSQHYGKHPLDWWIFGFLILTFLATATAAYFTGQQWLTAQDTEKRQLRAYIGFVPGGIENFGDPQKQLFNMTRKNYGLTPAYNVRAGPVVGDVVKIGGASAFHF